MSTSVITRQTQGPQGLQGSPGVTGATGIQGVQGVTGATGPAAIAGNVSTPTAIWLPIGQSGADLTSWLTTVVTGGNLNGGSGLWTGAAAVYNCQPNAIADVNATVLATNGNGMSGMAKLDINATFVRAAGNAQLLGVPIVTNQRNSLQASGWGVNLVPTGVAFALLVSTPSTPSIGITGTTLWSALLQINERTYP